MKPLNLETFNAWLEMYGKASEENNLHVLVELFAPNAKYYETPFDEPMIGLDAIYKYWRLGAKTFKDKKSTYEILSVKENLGVARWQSKFTDIQSGRRFALDCLFLVEFNHNDTCKLFREWWHLREVGAN